MRQIELSVSFLNYISDSGDLAESSKHTTDVNLWRLSSSAVWAGIIIRIHCLSDRGILGSSVHCEYARDVSPFFLRRAQLNTTCSLSGII